MTLQVQSRLLTSGAVGEWNVVVGNIVEEMDFVLVKEEAGSDRMYWSITPTLVEESTILVERLEKVEIGFRSKPIQVTNFEVGPHMAMVVGLSAVITQKTHGIVLGNMLGMCFHELLGAVPQGRDGLHVFIQTQHETVLLLVVRHVLEYVVVNIAEELDARLYSPVPFIIEHQWLTEEEA